MLELGKIWTNPNVGLKTQLQLSLLTVHFLINPKLGLSIFDPNLAWKNPAFWFYVCGKYERGIIV